MSKVNVVGLGSAGCSIAKEFEKYPQYDVYKIDKEGEKAPNFYKIKAHERPEHYEANPPKMKSFFKKAKGEVLFIVSGSGIVSGASLVILEHLKKCQITILYIKPDLELLSEMRTLQERVVYNVLQEYTRSGVFEQMILVDNNKIEEIVGDLPLKEYYAKINEVIASSVHMINVFRYSDSFIDNFSCSNDIARIASISAVNVETGEEKSFFPLDNVREKCYYYGISKEIIESDGKFFSTLKEQIKQKRVNEVKVSYGIYQTNYEHNYAFCLEKSSTIQK
jgi:hypothetical protein